MPRPATREQDSNETSTHAIGADVGADGELWLYNLRRWIYLLAMIISLFGRVVHLTRVFTEPGELPRFFMVLITSSPFMFTIFAATLHNHNQCVMDSFGIGVALWPADSVIGTKLATYYDPDREISILRLVVAGQVVYATYAILIVLMRQKKNTSGTMLFVAVLRRSWHTTVVPMGLAELTVRRHAVMYVKRTIFPTHACATILALLAAPIGTTASFICIALEEKLGLRNTNDILARARLGRGSEYTVEYHVASVFYGSFAMIAALVGASLQDTELKSLVAALGVLVLPNLLSMGDGPLCFSLSAAMTGVVEVKSVDQLLIMTATTRRELLKSLLNSRRRSDSVSGKNLSFARASLRGGLEIKRTFTSYEIKDAGVKICRHVIKYPDGVRWMVSKPDCSLLHVHRGEHAVVSEGHDIDACLLVEHGDLNVEGTPHSRERGDI